jgi:hypothetical protein
VGGTQIALIAALAATSQAVFAQHGDFAPMVQVIIDYLKNAGDECVSPAFPGERSFKACREGSDPGSLIIRNVRDRSACGQGRTDTLEVTEAVLNHISGSRAGIAGVYQRHDWAVEKRSALDSWAAYVLAAVDGRTARPNVVTLLRSG